MQPHLISIAKLAAASAALLIMNACTSISGPSTGSIEQAGFGTTKAGEAATLYTLTNRNGITAKVTDKLNQMAAQ